ncbi:MAG: MBL fold metallo-hydrolase [candidate division Zixibacteria bacterium]|nr:MBL fold metallo-hydrolase [candidate division Zixibacteria bacterium]
MDMRLKIIGCSSGMASAQKSTSCYLLEIDRIGYLLDCGDGTAQAIRRLKINPNTISKIFISHMHSDHSMGLPFLVQLMHLLRRELPLDIYLPREAEDGFKRLLYMTYLFPGDLGFDITFHGLDRKSTYEDSLVKFEFVLNRHLQGKRDFIMSRALPNRMQCFSLIAEHDRKRLVYTADVLDSEDVALVADNADLLLSEGMHIDLERMPQLMLDKNVRKLLLTHLPNNIDNEKISADFAKAGFDNLAFARAGMEIIV